MGNAGVRHNCRLREEHMWEVGTHPFVWRGSRSLL